MVARGERFLRVSFGLPAGFLAILIWNAAIEPELNAAMERIADAVADFMAMALLEERTGAELKSSLRRS